MNLKLRNRLLFFGSTAVLGGLSMGVYGSLLHTCIDEKGLLVPGALLWLLAGLAAVYGAVLLYAVSTVGGDGADPAAPCIPKGLMQIAAGCLLALQVSGLGLDAGWKVLLAYGGAGAMVFLGVCRMLGRKPTFVPGLAVCVMFMLLLIGEYTRWSASPKLYLYAYRMLCHVFAMLCAFHRTCWDAGILQRKKLLLTAFAAAFCAIATLPSASDPMVYVAIALWSLGAACTTGVLPREQEGASE